MHYTQYTYVHMQGFMQDCLLGGGTFRKSEIDIKHTFSGGSGGMPPRKVLTNLRLNLVVFGS